MDQSTGLGKYLYDRSRRGTHHQGAVTVMQGWRVAVRLAAAFILVPLFVGLIGCTAEPPQMGTGTADASGNHPPVIHSLSLVPNPVVRQGVVTAVVETKDADQDEVQLRFRWLVNDVPVLGESSSTFNPSGTKRGDRLTVEVTPYDGKLEGTPTRAVDGVGNTPPVVRAVVLGPIEPKAGDAIKATVDANDMDGDAIRYTYRWLRNNQVVLEGEQDSLDTAGFLRDDVVAVAVIPHDKDATGKEVMSQLVTLANRPPKFTSTAPASMAQGLLNYAVTAVDPENDPVTFLLEAAPPGMTIDERTGHIQWVVPTASTGSYRVRVVVKDSREGWASQEFDVSINPSSPS